MRCALSSAALHVQTGRMGLPYSSVLFDNLSVGFGVRNNGGVASVVLPWRRSNFRAREGIVLSVEAVEFCMHVTQLWVWFGFAKDVFFFSEVTWPTPQFPFEVRRMQTSQKYAQN